MFVLKKNFDRMQEWAEQNQDAYLQVTKRNIDLMFELADAHQALEDIIAQATAKPNATVARMVSQAWNTPHIEYNVQLHTDFSTAIDLFLEHGEGRKTGHYHGAPLHQAG